MHRTRKDLTILCVAIGVSALRAASLEIELDGVSPGGELVAEAGARLRVDGWVVLAGGDDRVEGWTLSVAGRGAGVYFVERVTELCDAPCVADLTGFEVASHAAGVIDPRAHGDQGQGVVASAVLDDKEVRRWGAHRVLPFRAMVAVPDDPGGETVEIEFRDGLQDERGTRYVNTVVIDGKDLTRGVGLPVSGFTFTVRASPAEPGFALGFELDGVEDGGTLEGVPGDTISRAGYVTLDSPEAGVSGWSFGFGANGAEVSFGEQTVEGCDRPCLSELLGLDPRDVFFHYAEIVDPAIADQGPGVISAVALRPFPSPVPTLPAGISRLQPFELAVRVPETRTGRVVLLEFRDGLVGSREPMDIDIRARSGTVDAARRPLRFRVRPTAPFRLGLELDGLGSRGEVRGGAGETVSVKGHVTLESPLAGVSGWTFGLGARGAGVSFDDRTVEGCGTDCLAGLLGLEADDVFFLATQVVDPSLGGQGPGVVTAVALNIFSPRTVLSEGISRVLPVAFDVQVPESPEGEVVELEFRDGLVGSGQPVAIGINFENRNIDPVLDPYRLLVRPGVVPRFVRGDCSGDGAVNISDPVCMIGWFFTGRAPDCLAMGDANGDRLVDLSDLVSLLLFLFRDGAPPVAPFPGCGPGESEADELLGCETPPQVCGD